MYLLLKLYTRLMVNLYCHRIAVANKHLLYQQGPLLITANHPNSFFDALIVAVYAKEKVHFLARGDVFKNKEVASVLKWLGLIPIYRISEGAGNLHLNEATFETCRQLFRNKGIVLIFIEGICENNWILRPFKKGAARLALSSWLDVEKPGMLKIMPLALSYNHYRGYGKNILLHLGNLLQQEDFHLPEEEGKAVNYFNHKIRDSISNSMVKIDKLVNKQLVHAAFAAYRTKDEVEKCIQKEQAPEQKIFVYLLYMPALIAQLVHAPLYLPLSMFVAKKTAGTVFYDSVLFASLLFLYPLYLVLIFVVAYLLFGAVAAVVSLLLVPILAKTASAYKAQATSL